MTNNEILEWATELRDRADSLIGKMLEQTHTRDAEIALFGRHARRNQLCQLRQIVSELDGLVENAELAAHAEGYREGALETRNEIEADRHEPVAPWETEP